MVEISRSCLNPGVGPLIPGEAALEIEVVRLEIGRGPRPEHAIGARAQLDLQRRDDGARDVLLHGEHVFQLAIVRLGPQLVAVPRAYELRGDTHPIPAPPGPAL